jgi:hypothetical protein
MAEDSTYQTKVYRERGGDAEVINSGGILRGHSGGIMSMESGFIFGLASQEILAKDMARVVHSQLVPLLITPVTAATNLAVSNLPYNTKFVKILGLSTVLHGSFWLTSCSAGAEVFLQLCGDSTGTFGCASTLIDVSCSGCILLGSVGDAISGFEMHTSLASDCGVHLVAFVDNVWSIVGQFGDINE